MTLAHRTRTALAVLALAAGLIGTALPTSALAAQSGPGTRPSPTVPGPVPPPPPRINPPLPDVSVKVVGSNGSNLPPDHLDVAFNLQTTGADANNVALTPYCIYALQNDDPYNPSPWYPRKEKGLIKQMSLSASWPVPVPFLVTCNPQGNELVEMVTLTADVPGGDSNPSNNSAYWDHLDGPWK